MLAKDYGARAPHPKRQRRLAIGPRSLVARLHIPQAAARHTVAEVACAAGCEPDAEGLALCGLHAALGAMSSGGGRDRASSGSGAESGCELRRRRAVSEAEWGEPAPLPPPPPIMVRAVVMAMMHCDWVEGFDQADQRYYYYNRVTGETSACRPPPDVAFEPAQVVAAMAPFGGDDDQEENNGCDDDGNGYSSANEDGTHDGR